METLKKNVAELVKVKTIVTLMILIVFVVLALRGDIPADNVMVIVSTVVAFYFGTQHEKAAAKADAANVYTAVEPATENAADVEMHALEDQQDITVKGFGG